MSDRHIPADLRALVQHDAKSTVSKLDSFSDLRGHRNHGSTQKIDQVIGQLWYERNIPLIAPVPDPVDGQRVHRYEAPFRSVVQIQSDVSTRRSDNSK